METLRLRRIQEPSRVERLLEAYVSRTGNLPDEAYQVGDKTELPQRLQIVAARRHQAGTGLVMLGTRLGSRYRRNLSICWRACGVIAAPLLSPLRGALDRAGTSAALLRNPGNVLFIGSGGGI
jgi:hypothetical protein